MEFWYQKAYYVVDSKYTYYVVESKYIQIIKFGVTHQKLRAWENLLDFRKRGKHPLKVKES